MRLYQHKAIPFHRQLIGVALLAFAATVSAVANARDDAAAIEGDPSQIALSAAQRNAVSFVFGVRPQKPVPLFLFTDPNKDPDDLSVLVSDDLISACAPSSDADEELFLTQ